MFDDILKLFDFLLRKRYKLAIVSYYYPFEKPSTSGVGTHVYNLVTNLARKGFEVHVFCYSERDSVRRINLGEGKIVIHHIYPGFRFEVNDPVIQKRIRYALFENKVLNEFIYEHSRAQFKIVHTHGWLTSSAFMIKHLHNVPWIHTVHALEKNRLNSMTDDEKRLYRLTSWVEETLVDADLLVAVSESIKKEIAGYYDKKLKKTVVIPNGVDLSLFKPNGIDSKSVLTVSRFSKEKGSDFLPVMIDRVLSSDKECRFVAVIAETTLPGLKDVQDKLKELQEKWKERFVWVSRPVSAVELVKHYQESSIYVQPSLYEAFGLCILEAMACGNAVVATKVGGIPEATGKSAILVRPDPEELSRAIIRLIKSKRLREKYRSLALEQSKKFDWEIIANRIIENYYKLSENK